MKHLFTLNTSVAAYKDILVVNRPPKDTSLPFIVFTVVLRDGKEIQSARFSRDEFERELAAFLASWAGYIDAVATQQRESQLI